MVGIHTTYKFRHFRQGRLIWASGIGELEGSIRKGSPAVQAVINEQPWQDNELVDEGEQAMLDVYFRGATGPTEFFFRLYNETPAETDGLSDLTTEVTGDGYAPAQLGRDSTDWPTLSLDSGDYQVQSSTKTFVATGAWTDASHLVLATSSDNSGRLIAFAPLSAVRTLQADDTLDVSFAVKLA